MATIMNNPSIADLLKAIKNEDLGLTPKASKRTIASLPTPRTNTMFMGIEKQAMQDAMSYAIRLSNIVE